MHGNVRLSRISAFQAPSSNKAASSDHQIRTYTLLAQLGLSGIVTMEQLIEAMPAGAIARIASNSETMTNYISDTPATSKYWFITIDKAATNYVICHAMRSGYSGEMIYVGRYHSAGIPKFRGWVLQATAEPPQVYDLPIVDAIAASPCYYFKTQENVVHAYMRFVVKSAIQNGATIATLPAGFRPAAFMDVIVLNKKGSVSVGISRDGRIVLYGASLLVTDDICSAVFPPFVPAA